MALLVTVCELHDMNLMVLLAETLLHEIYNNILVYKVLDALYLHKIAITMENITIVVSYTTEFTYKNEFYINIP